jgi:LacI family transcriptional regulator
MDDLSRFCCQNPDCPSAGRRGQGNLTVCARYGTAGQRRLLYCRTCKYRFSERKSTPLFDCRLPHDQLLAALRHLADGCGVRQTARLVGVGKNAVGRLARAAGRHAQRLHDERVAFSPRYPQSATRREVVLRRQEAEAL